MRKVFSCPCFAVYKYLHLQLPSPHTAIETLRLRLYLRSQRPVFIPWPTLLHGCASAITPPTQAQYSWLRYPQSRRRT